MNTITHILDITKDKRTGVCTAVVEYSIKDDTSDMVVDHGLRSMVVSTMPYVGMEISEGV